MERALLSLFGREHRAEVYRRLATAAGLQLSPRACWLMYRIADFAPLSVPDLAQLLGIGTAELHERKTELQADGYVTIAVAPDGAEEDMVLTPACREAADRLEAAREAGIGRLMEGWQPDQNPELRLLIGKITRNLVATDRPPDREPPRRRHPRQPVTARPAGGRRTPGRPRPGSADRGVRHDAAAQGVDRPACGPPGAAPGPRRRPPGRAGRSAA